MIYLLRLYVARGFWLQLPHHQLSAWLSPMWILSISWFHLPGAGGISCRCDWRTHRLAQLWQKPGPREQNDEHAAPLDVTAASSWDQPGGWLELGLLCTAPATGSVAVQRQPWEVKTQCAHVNQSYPRRGHHVQQRCSELCRSLMTCLDYADQCLGATWEMRSRRRIASAYSDSETKKKILYHKVDGSYC
jgi:hypothetical protein